MDNIQGEWRSEFEMADLFWPDLQAMRDSVEYYSREGSKRERRLASKLARALLWIEREIWVAQQDSA